MNFNLVIEILIGGIFAVVWILLIICKILGFDLDYIIQTFSLFDVTVELQINIKSNYRLFSA